MLEHVTFESLNFLFCLDGILLGLLVDRDLSKSIDQPVRLLSKPVPRSPCQGFLSRLVTLVGLAICVGGGIYNIINPRVRPETICPCSFISAVPFASGEKANQGPTEFRTRINSTTPFCLTKCKPKLKSNPSHSQFRLMSCNFRSSGSTFSF